MPHGEDAYLPVVLFDKICDPKRPHEMSPSPPLARLAAFLRFRFQVIINFGNGLIDRML
ncbi:MAG: hypothetical protein U0805_08055 [Pirellulales bacterium]